MLTPRDSSEARYNTCHRPKLLEQPSEIPTAKTSLVQQPAAWEAPLVFRLAICFAVRSNERIILDQPATRYAGKSCWLKFSDQNNNKLRPGLCHLSNLILYAADGKSARGQENALKTRPAGDL